MQIAANLYPTIYRLLNEAGMLVHSRSIDGAPSVLMCDGDPVLVQTVIDGFTPAMARSELKARSLQIAKELRDKVVANVSAGEMASWSIKRAEAAAYAASGDAADAPLLAAEAAARGITLPAMLAKVQANATAFAMLEAAIGGADGKHRDAIDALQTLDQLRQYDLNAGWPAV